MKMTDRHSQNSLGPQDPFHAQFLPSFHLVNKQHPKGRNPLFSPQFFPTQKKRYLSNDNSDYTWQTYKTTKKMKENSVAGKYGQKPPIGVPSADGVVRRGSRISVVFSIMWPVPLGALVVRGHLVPVVDEITARLVRGDQP